VSWVPWCHLHEHNKREDEFHATCAPAKMFDHDGKLILNQNALRREVKSKTVLYKRKTTSAKDIYPNSKL
jgi:hypothetical protein